MFAQREVELVSYKESIVDDIIDLRFLLDNIHNDEHKSKVRDILHSTAIVNTSFCYCSKDNRTITNHAEFIEDLELHLKQARRLCKRNATSALVTKLEMYIHPLEQTAISLRNIIRP